MQYWKAHYKDALHDADIRIINAEDTTEPLSFTLDGIRFQGRAVPIFTLPKKHIMMRRYWIFRSLWTSFAMKAAEKACISKMPFVVSARR